jgi:hypothetical protein
LASDDRTGEVVKSKIKAALEMQAIVNDSQSTTNNEGKHTFAQKPNLLIIDEIDGASSGGGNDVGDKSILDIVAKGLTSFYLIAIVQSFIKVLVNLVTAEDGSGFARNQRGKCLPSLPIYTTRQIKECLSGSKKSQYQKPLLRPIICICNDPYVYCYTIDRQLNYEQYISSPF